MPPSEHDREQPAHPSTPVQAGDPLDPPPDDTGAGASGEAGARRRAESTPPPPTGGRPVVPPPDDVSESVRQRVEAWVPELVKRAVAAGMGAVFTTEEGIRRLTKEMPLPKDVAGYLVSTASTTKDELFRIVAREMREFLQTVNISEEIAKMLTTLSFEVKTEIRFIPNDQKYGGVEPDVKARVKLKRSSGESRPVASSPRRRMFRRTRNPSGSGGSGGDSGSSGGESGE